MGLYRANPKDGVAWITGASTGIGRAMARDLCALGYTVAVTARDEDRLVTLIEEAAGLPGRIVSFPCDVTDANGMKRTVALIERDAGPIVLAIFNAGNYFPTRADRLDALNIVNTFEINFFGVMYGMVPVVEFMRRHGKGHIVFVGSASSYFGWPSASAYSASKAALNSIAEGLKFDFDKMNIRIQVVNPGFVDTPLTQKTRVAMPTIVPVDKASQRMIRAIERSGFESSFPWRLTWFLKVLRILPQPVRFWIVNHITGWKSRPLGRPRKARELTE